VKIEDALFLRCYRHIRSAVPQQRVTLIPSRDGFRTPTDASTFQRFKNTVAALFP